MESLKFTNGVRARNIGDCVLEIAVRFSVCLSVCHVGDHVGESGDLFGYGPEKKLALPFGAAVST